MHKAFIGQLGNCKSALLICGGAHVKNLLALFARYPLVFSTMQAEYCPKGIEQILGLGR